VSLIEQLPVAAFGPLATRAITQTKLPPFCTVIDPVGDPDVPDVTLAEMRTELSFPNAAVDDDTDKVVELVAGKTERRAVADAAVKLVSPG
jgi:hypothetical protein